MLRGLSGDRLTDPRQWQVLRERTFYGYDFDATMVRLGLMNLMQHDIEHPNLDYADTLSKNYDDENCYDVVLANPPFKGSIDKGAINENLRLKTTKTELLFVNRILNLLRIGSENEGTGCQAPQARMPCARRGKAFFSRSIAPAERNVYSLADLCFQPCVGRYSSPYRLR